MRGDAEPSVEALRVSFHQASKSSVCCPLCRGNKTLPLTNLDRHDLGLNVVACRRCGLGMISPRPKPHWFDEFYENNYWPVYISSRFNDLDEMYIEDQCGARAEQIFTTITPSFQQAPSSYLDIGCGQGAMLAEFRKRYPTASFVGVEPSPHAAEFCRRRHGINIEVVHWNTLNAAELPGPFDLITLIHVLEHVLDPVDVLSRAVNRLSKTGLIYVEVPDLLSDHWSGKDFFHIAHVWYFHESALRNLFLRCGLNVVSVTRGAAEVWPWAIGFVGQRSRNGPELSETVPSAPAEFRFRLKEHMLSRQRPVMIQAPPRREPFAQQQEETGASSQLRIRKPIPEWIKTPVHVFIKQYTSVRVDEIQALEKRLEAADRLLEFVSADDSNRWLYQHRLERMDATLNIFDEKRREFHLDRYRFAAQQVKGKHVLDCASGTGYGVRMLRESGFAASVIGVDIDNNAIAYALKKHHVEATSFICSSGDALPLRDASVDIVVSFETIEHVSDDVPLVEEFYRVLRTEGILIVSTPNQWPLATAPYHVREYNRSSFLRVLELKFDCLELYNQNSGCDTVHNRGQPRGIVATTMDNEQSAECYIAICRRRKNSQIRIDL
jgi:ubiquinone/menaquinone biosynthesis C-methylase UbiE